MVANTLLLSVRSLKCPDYTAWVSKVCSHPCRSQRARVFNCTVPTLAPDSMWLQLGIKSPKNTSAHPAVFTQLPVDFLETDVFPTPLEAWKQLDSWKSCLEKGACPRHAWGWSSLGVWPGWPQAARSSLVTPVEAGAWPYPLPWHPH